MKKILILAASCLSLAACKKDISFGPSAEKTEIGEKKPVRGLCVTGLGTTVTPVKEAFVSWSNPDNRMRAVLVVQYDSTTRAVLYQQEFRSNRAGDYRQQVPYLSAGATILLQATGYSDMKDACTTTGQFYR